MISIRTKLSLWLTGLIVLGTVIGLILFESMLRQAFHDSIINRLEEDLEHIMLATHINDGDISIDQSQLSSFYKPAYSGRYFQLNLPNEVIRSRSLWDMQLDIEPLAPNQTRVWQAKGPKNNDMQLLSLGLNSSSANVTATLTVAQDLSIGRRVFSEVYGTKLGVNLAMLVAMIMGIFLILRQSFKPVRQIQDALSRLQQGEINALELSNIPPEVRPLAKTYNELLEYTAKQIERSRNNLGNLSHGLKTPLAVMQQQVEALGLKDPETAIALQQQLDSIHKMVERKLAAARITGDMLPAAQLVIPRDLHSLANTLNKVHRNKSIECNFELDPNILRLPIHREDGMELLGNLLDNAFKWAKHQVSIQLSRQQERLCLCIDDDGPGVADDELDKLTQRGTRLDEAVMGHGLGLSIVKEIAEQYEIELKFDHSTRLGGLRIELTFS
ncbi:MULTISPECIES: ATP-binding protein [Shewanella]|uniref:histidine kinase n=2 Tax=Shewanella putrefaciens TaxID=24 RepID=E6XI20_SHEP2|nr:MULTISPECIES: ATP-binding protein [Shewanella]ABM26337.1 integral membrane sensor signal transduction histidine kinase [Shewanella sp. W3-18-1]MCA1897191.1 GHKL domain-containing protein [Shewanella putrefaciens]QGS51149.1 GHKL domain-containing protein [Shewanella putrefaciens]UXK08086.1 ATP-binding protein [Shewanella putrefaciens]